MELKFDKTEVKKSLIQPDKITPNYWQRDQ